MSTSEFKSDLIVESNDTSSRDFISGPEAALPDTSSSEDGIRYFAARRGWGVVDLRELWAFRDLFVSLALRDLRVRYRQTAIGVAWAVIRPVTLMVVFVALFRLLGRIPASDEKTYAVTLFAGLLPWQLFATTLTMSTSSLVANQHILTKVYFPRLILPMIPLAVGFVDFAVAFLVLIGLMVWYGVVPTFGLLFVPAFVAMAIFTAFALSTWLSAANALYRDVEHAVPFVVQVGMFLSPVVYEMRAVIPDRWQTLYALNPLVCVLEGFRWAILGGEPPPLVPSLLSFMIVVAVFTGGLWYFRRVERFVADRI